MNPSLDQKLKLALAQLLPNAIEIHDYTSGISHPCFMWSPSRLIEHGQIKDTEWLHVCNIIEYGMTPDEYCEFDTELWVAEHERTDTSGGNEQYASSSWQQRAQVILRVKEVKI